jgi:hypothetical protein
MDYSNRYSRNRADSDTVPINHLSQNFSVAGEPAPFGQQNWDRSPPRGQPPGMGSRDYISYPMKKEPFVSQNEIQEPFFAASAIPKNDVYAEEAQIVSKGPPPNQGKVKTHMKKYWPYHCGFCVVSIIINIVLG